MPSLPIRLVSLASLITCALHSGSAFADHDRRDKFRGVGKVGFGVARVVPAWFGVDGLSFAVGDRLDTVGDALAPRPLGFRVRSGLDVSRRLGLELHGAYGVDRQAESLDRFDTWVLGGFVRGGVPLGPATQFNALLGVSTVGVAQREAGLITRDQAAGLAWGFNLDVKLTPRTSITGGWMRYASGDEAFAAVSGWSLGLRVGFF